MAKHHNLDITPIPESVLYVNEPELADRTVQDKVILETDIASMLLCWRMKSLRCWKRMRAVPRYFRMR